MASETKATLSKDEAAIYDRQIRVWGVEAQKRMRSSSVLVVGMNGFSAEICKNLVLTGVGALTILDGKKVAAVDLGANFFLRIADIGANRAEAARARISELNPNVRVTADASDVKDKPASFFSQFTLVCLTDSDIVTQLEVNERCRSLEKSPGFLSGQCQGLYGYVLEDLVSHKYSVPETGGEMTTRYPRLTQVIETSWQSVLSANGRRMKEATTLYLAFQALFQFRLKKGRAATLSDADMSEMSELVSSLTGSSSSSSPLIPDAAVIKKMIGSAGTELTPACAIFGGIVAQELLKVASGRDAPYDNVIVYDARQGSANVLRIQ